MTAARFAALDTLRIGALLLVTWQHAAALLGQYAQTQWRGISPGQSGVAIFCAIAGFLAFRVQPESLAKWCGRRLLVIFPAYWLVTLAAFAMALALPQKPITWGLFISQMLGLGYFTHGWELINVVSWFVSLILLCYGLSLLAWRSRYPSGFWMFVCVIAMVLVSTRTEVAMSRHILAFALGALFALRRMQARSVAPWCVVALASLLFGMFVDPQYFYAGIGALALQFGIAGWMPASTIATRMSGYAYEYFLVHGLCLAVVMHVIASPVVAIAGGIGLAMIAAMLLAHAQHALVARFSKRFEASGGLA